MSNEIELYPLKNSTERIKRALPFWCITPKQKSKEIAKRINREYKNLSDKGIKEWWYYE